MLISQFLRADGSVGVVCREGSEAAVVRQAAGTYDLALQAAATGRR